MSFVKNLHLAYPLSMGNAFPHERQSRRSKTDETRLQNIHTIVGKRVKMLTNRLISNFEYSLIAKTYLVSTLYPMGIAKHYL